MTVTMSGNYRAIIAEAIITATNVGTNSDRIALAKQNSARISCQIANISEKREKVHCYNNNTITTTHINF